MKDDYEYDGQNESNGSGSNIGGGGHNGASLTQPQAVNEQYWREKEKVIVSTKIYAHQCIIAYKSPYFTQYFKDRKLTQGT
jgi:hypothetical protein